MQQSDIVRLDSLIRLEGVLTVQVHDARTGAIIDEYQMKNLVTTDGKNLVRDLLAGDAVTALTHFAVGTGTNTPAVGDSSLQTEVYRDTITQFIDSSGTLQVKYYLPSTQANSNTLSEAGILNGSGGGAVLYNRVLISPTIAKTSSIAVTFTWDLNIL